MKKITNFQNSDTLEYSLKNEIGSGLTARVFRAYHSRLKTVCAKVIETPFLTSNIGSQLIQNQLIIHSKLRHQNILKFYESKKIDKKLIIFTQYCEGGDLSKLVSSMQVNEKKNIQIFQGIVKGCKYLANNGIIHRDLKPANILMKQDQPKIADFGFAVTLKDEDLLKINAGSPLYMAPESLSKKQFTYKSDIFSLGVIFFQIMTGHTPWKALSQKDLLYKIKNIPPSVPLKCSTLLKRLILKCLSINKQERPTIQQVQLELQKVNNVVNKNIQITYPQKKIYQIQNRQKKSLTQNLNIINMKKNAQVYQYNKINKLRKKCLQKQNKQGMKKLSKRKKQVSTGKKTKRKIQCQQVIKQIKPQSFKFLPNCLIKKLQLILTKYKQILRGQEIKIKLQETLYKDENMQKIKQCKSQMQLWELSQGTIRRIYRLTKNYKGFKSCLISIEKLYNIIIQYKTH